MNQNQLKNIIYPLALVLFFVVNCSKKAEITWDTKVYAEPSFSSKVVGEMKKGEVVEPCNYLNHERLQKEFIKVKSAKLEGYVSSKVLVIGQNPENSVFTWGYRKDYQNFYNPTDKAHYPQGYEWPPLKALSKEKIPLNVLLKDEKLD